MSTHTVDAETKREIFRKYRRGELSEERAREKIGDDWADVRAAVALSDGVRSSVESDNDKYLG